MRDKKDKEKTQITDDPVKNFEKWKRKYNKTKKRVKQVQKTTKKRDYEVERETIQKLVNKYSEINPKEAVKFSDFPLSKKTLKGLHEGQYRQPTEIQRQTIGFALQGRDVLGAAKTGSGKTLAFLIPVLECLYREQWTAMDGLGALIISPTRELAYQTFEVLRKVGKNHEFSAGLVIGGKDLKDESEKIHRTNIIICTPGRLLQHMDETATFHASDLHMLVLDEADRILDMGFADTLNAIIENLPKTRQTLLFSATQTKSVKDLARLSLKNPEYVWVHEQAKFSTPATLEQNYVVCELHQKVNMLFSFLRSHLKKKIIVFFACCKEVQYLFRVFCRLRPGISVLALHGKQQQMKRVEVYNDFVRKTSAVLFATDIAARGLDFPAVNWVLQFDCPEDANTYIHRVGRTARYKEGGEALLVLLPSEEKGMIAQLQDKKVPINKIKVNPEKLVSVQQKLEAFLAQEKEQKERAQRCFVSYLRSVYLMKNKDVFDVFQLKLPEYAMSLGLAVAPRVRFLNKAQQQKSGVMQDNSGAAGHESEDELKSFKAQLKGEQSKSQSSQSEEEEEEEDDDDDVDDDEDEDEETLKPAALLCGFNEEDEDDQKEQDLLTVKRKDVFNINEESQDDDEVNKQHTSGVITVIEKRLKEKAARREASKQHKEEKKKDDEDDDDDGDEEEMVAYLSGADEEFDPSTLPDPDKVRNSESSSEEEEGDSSDRGGRKRSFSSDSSEDDDSDDEVQQTHVGKKKPRKESTLTPLDTGLSLAEDEELVLHLLGSHS
uniref:ATP-dependent RNA helicase n=1 Tax=Cyprinus carpio TaxID=7962 RepID=A0A8C2JF72_CYPCA